MCMCGSRQFCRHARALVSTCRSQDAVARPVSRINAVRRGNAAGGSLGAGGAGATGAGTGGGVAVGRRGAPGPAPRLCPVVAGLCPVVAGLCPVVPGLCPVVPGLCPVVAGHGGQHLGCARSFRGCARSFRGTGASTLLYPGHWGTWPALCRPLAGALGPAPRDGLRGSRAPAPERARGGLGCCRLPGTPPPAARRVTWPPRSRTRNGAGVRPAAAAGQPGRARRA